MKIKINKVFNDTTSIEFEVDKQDAKDAFAEALFLTEPNVCGLCKKENIFLQVNRPKGFFYLKRVCSDCRATSTMGLYKEGGYFWNKWEEAFNKNSQPNKEAEQAFEGV
jgi:hypothetical protein